MALKKAIYQYSPHFIRTLLLNLYAVSLNIERYGRKFERLMNEFERNEKFSMAELEEYQRERLTILIRHAYEHVPYYREVMDQKKLVPSDIKDVKDISKLPVLTREDVKKYYERLKADNIPWYKIRHGHTSGTTGSPLSFLWDISICVAHHTADWRQKRWAGFKFGEPFISMQGRQIVPINRHESPFWIMNYAHNQLLMSSFHLKDDYLAYYLEKIEKFRPKAIEGYPSSLYILARFMTNNDCRIRIPAVLTSSETLLPLQRDILEECFQCKVFDFYGMAERVIYASECEHHCGRHLNMDYGITEVVDAGNNPVSVGTIGTLVGTSLWNFAMPLIRYKTSDVSFILPEACTCGRSFPLISPITTKAEDIVVLKDGRLVPSSILTHPFKPLTNIKMSQIIQDSVDELTILIIKDRGYMEKDSLSLITGMKERVGQEMEIRLKFVDDIPKTKSGKFRWVISKVPVP